jgi:hypothetical protein
MDPDYYIEQFWLGFKQSIINYCNNIKESKSMDINKTLVDSWSCELNQLKKEKKYNEIEYNIRNYMTKYAFYIMETSTDTYNAKILDTNIKRWNNITITFNFIQSEYHNNLLIIFSIYLELQNLKLFKNVESMMETNNYDNIIIFAFKNRKNKILELLRKVSSYQLNDNIRRIYPLLIFNDDIKYNKLFIQYKNLYNNL